jgi:hypothetical protein
VADEQPVRIVLTPDQRETLRRLSGQSIDAVEVTPEDVKAGGGPLRFLWRRSVATGIPRQAWVEDIETPAAPRPEDGERRP